jgi:uncharacterized protein YcbX
LCLEYFCTYAIKLHTEDTMSIKISSLHIYPIKSAGGMAVSSLATGHLMSLSLDRRWMVVDDTGMFVAQRGSRGLGIGIKSTCQVSTHTEGDFLFITAPEMPPLKLPLDGVYGPILRVQVWKDTCLAAYEGKIAAEWFTEFLSRERPGKYRLVRLPEATPRKSRHGIGEMAFADGYPLLVISEASLADLNARMDVPLPMNRFRPNIVVTGCEAFGEDRWQEAVTGERGNICLVGRALCVRCPITTTDQQTAERGKEPLKTLATYRRGPEGEVVFGHYFDYVGAGAMRVGDKVEVVDSK